LEYLGYRYLFEQVSRIATKEPNMSSASTRGIRQTVETAIMAALVIAALLTAAISLAAVATAKGQEGGVVCTGTQLTAGSCQPMALQATPIGSMPLGCQPSSGDSVACGRRGFHVAAAAAAAAQSAESTVSGPTQAVDSPSGQHSGITDGAQPQASRHAAR
jgi:hypothetical protein